MVSMYKRENKIIQNKIIILTLTFGGDFRYVQNNQ